MESYPPQVAAASTDNPYAEISKSEPESIWSKSIGEPEPITSTEPYAPIQSVNLNASSQVVESTALQENPYSTEAPQTQQAKSEPPATVPPSSGRQRILVAEDNHINQMVMENMLDSDKYDVHFQMDGKSAVEAHLANPYDIILMDISMPEMNGIEATEAIRTQEKVIGTQQVPIVAVTAHAMKSHQETYKEAGMNDFLPKPISKQELDAVLLQWLNVTPQTQRLSA